MATALAVSACASAGVATPTGAAPSGVFRVEEASISDIQRALRSGAVTCRGLVDQYLARIDAYDKKGPYLNALVVINPEAGRVADSLDAHARAGGTLGPLHCTPTIVKDNFETIEMTTTAGSLSLSGFVAGRDAFQVKQMRAAGAIVLAKSNMAEFAFSPVETISSILAGYTRNPYALERVTAGSSGGTAAAVAASFGAVGLGTDTGNSIRGPSSHQALVGIRSTMGLTSRSHIVPLNLFADIAGPLARTVADAVAVFQTIVGPDADDPATRASVGRTIPSYAESLVADGLRGARIGVMTQAYNANNTDAEINAVFARALEDMRRAGATIVEGVTIPELDSLRNANRGGCNEFKYSLEQWLTSTGGKAPMQTLQAIIQSNRFHPSIQQRLQTASMVTTTPQETPGCQARVRLRESLGAAITRLMDAQRLDALVYPTWSNPPRLIGDLNTTPAGDNSQLFSPTTGFPAIQVPMGYTRETLPAGITFFGRAWAEPTLIRLAYGYEQATRHRRPPASVPPLR